MATNLFTSFYGQVWFSIHFVSLFSVETMSIQFLRWWKLVNILLALKVNTFPRLLILLPSPRQLPPTTTTGFFFPIFYSWGEKRTSDLVLASVFSFSSSDECSFCPYQRKTAIPLFYLFLRQIDDDNDKIHNKPGWYLVTCGVLRRSTRYITTGGSWLLTTFSDGIKYIILSRSSINEFYKRERERQHFRKENTQRR